MYIPPRKRYLEKPNDSKTLILMPTAFVIHLQVATFVSGRVKGDEKLHNTIIRGMQGNDVVSFDYQREHVMKNLKSWVGNEMMITSLLSCMHS